MRTMYPEIAAGGFKAEDSSVEFYTRVNALLRPDMTILDFGAGSGRSIQNEKAFYIKNLTSLRGKVSRVIGADVDAAVTGNPYVDESIVLQSSQGLPLRDQSIDMIISDWTFEHIEDPRLVAQEFGRILKPGGWICARTPNRWGYIGIAANLVSNKRHVAILKYAQPLRQAEDVFPTRYKLNTWSSFRSNFPIKIYEHAIFTMNSTPGYFNHIRIVDWLFRQGFRLTPKRFGALFLIFLRKRLRR